MRVLMMMMELMEQCVSSLSMKEDTISKDAQNRVPVRKTHTHTVFT